jgi:hypothetical protein
MDQRRFAGWAVLLVYVVWTVGTSHGEPIAAKPCASRSDSSSGALSTIRQPMSKTDLSAYSITPDRRPIFRQSMPEPSSMSSAVMRSPVAGTSMIMVRLDGSPHHRTALTAQIQSVFGPKHDAHVMPAGRTRVGLRAGWRGRLP